MINAPLLTDYSSARSDCAPHVHVHESSLTGHIILMQLSIYKQNKNKTLFLNLECDKEVLEVAGNNVQNSLNC